VHFTLAAACSEGCTSESRASRLDRCAAIFVVRNSRLALVQGAVPRRYSEHLPVMRANAHSTPWPAFLPRPSSQINHRATFAAGVNASGPTRRVQVRVNQRGPEQRSPSLHAAPHPGRPGASLTQGHPRRTAGLALAVATGGAGHPSAPALDPGRRLVPEPPQIAALRQLGPSYYGYYRAEVRVKSLLTTVQAPMNARAAKIMVKFASVIVKARSYSSGRFLRLTIVWLRVLTTY
jgi:hypothetical protein